MNSAAKMRYAKQFGAKSVEGMNPDARCPNMAPFMGRGAKVYVIGPRPSTSSDLSGDPLAGSGPRLVRGLLRKHRIKFCYDNACRTLPPNQRDPEKHEIEAFRADIETSILDSGASVVLLLGRPAIWWGMGEATPGKDAPQVCRGRHWPGSIRGTPIRFVASFDPNFVHRQVEANPPRSGVSWSSELLRFLERDIKLAKRLAAAEPERGFSAPLVAEDLISRVRIILEPAAILEALERLSVDGGPLTYDFETTALRPYGENARISTIGLCGASGEAFAFPFRHEKYGLPVFGRETFTRICKAIKRAFRKASVVIAHNAPFDLEWLGAEFGQDFLFEVRPACTLQDAYILDSRAGALGLNFLTMQYFGIAVKSLSGVNTRYVEMNPVDDLLRYNALDALLTSMLYTTQRAAITSRKLELPSELQRSRIRPAVVAQLQGIPVDQQVVNGFASELDAQRGLIGAEIRHLPEVKEVFKDHGEFNPASNQQLAALFHSLGRKEVVRADKTGKNKDTVDEDALKSIVETGGKGAVLAARVLEHRSVSKFHSTYVLPLVKGEKDSVVWPDGRVHTQFKLTGTQTGRWASEDPNVQNYPKRSEIGKRIRQAFIAESKGVILSIDYKQLEACVIAMLSNDRVWTRMVIEGYDVHLEWAEIVATRCPAAFAKATRESNWKKGSDKAKKKFRSLIKNQLVFPAFFGASARSIGSYIGIPEEDSRWIFHKFWSLFKGIRDWQKRLESEYLSRGYVQCGTKRRRYGPLNLNMVYNTPVQGTASEIVVSAMTRMSDYAYETEQPWLNPRLNIHDDLSLWVPEPEERRAAEQAVEIMVAPVFPFITVPLSVEVERGTNWGQLTPLLSHTGEVFKR